MGRIIGTFEVPPSLAIAEGATTPDPGGTGAKGATVWSSTLSALVRWSGTAWNALAVGTPLDVMGFYPGLPTTSAIMTRVPIARAVVFPASLTGSYGKASAAATAQTDFDVQKNGVSFGTMRFAAAATSATFISASGSTFAAGDVLSVVAPATPDSTLSNVGFSLAGTR